MFLNKNMAEMFDSPAKITAAKYVVKPGFTMSGRELSKLCGISHTWVIAILKEFEGINLVSSRRIGKTVIWTAKTGSYAYSAVEQLFGSRQMFKPVVHLRELLRERLKNSPVKKAVIFGSVAAGKETVTSDIDLFILVNTIADKSRIERTAENLSDECVKLYGNVLSFYILTEREYRSKRKLALIKNINGGIKII